MYEIGPVCQAHLSAYRLKQTVPQIEQPDML